MGEAFCRKIFKGVALAGAGVAIGAAVVSFSLKRVAAASRRSLNEVEADEQKKRKSASGSPSTTPSNTPASSANNSQESSSTSGAPVLITSSFGGSNASLASIKSGRRQQHPGASSKSLSRHPSGASTSGLSRSGSSLRDLHGSAASLASDYDLDGDGGSLGSVGSSGSFASLGSSAGMGSSAGNGTSSLEYHPSGDHRLASGYIERHLKDVKFISVGPISITPWFSLPPPPPSLAYSFPPLPLLLDFLLLQTCEVELQLGLAGSKLHEPSAAQVYQTLVLYFARPLYFQRRDQPPFSQFSRQNAVGAYRKETSHFRATFFQVIIGLAQPTMKRGYILLFRFQSTDN